MQVCITTLVSKCFLANVRKVSKEEGGCIGGWVEGNGEKERGIGSMGVCKSAIIGTLNLYLQTASLAKW